MSVIPKIAAVAPVERPKTLLVMWEDGALDFVDLAGVIARHATYAPLNRESVFNGVRVGDGGHHVVWPKEISIPSYALWQLARAQPHRR